MMRFVSMLRQRAEPLPLCFYGHPVLRQKSTDIDEITDEVRELADRMVETMRVNDGIGLAANQIGRTINIITVDIPAPEADGGAPAVYTTPGEAALMPRMPLVLINPKLGNGSEETATYEEGCLSIPDLRGTVERPIEIDLEARTLEGQTLNLRCGGLLARCLMHEVDHLKGVLFTDKVEEEDAERLEEPLRRMERRTKATLKKNKKRRR